MDIPNKKPSIVVSDTEDHMIIHKSVCNQKLNVSMILGVSPDGAIQEYAQRMEIPYRAYNAMGTSVMETAERDTAITEAANGLLVIQRENAGYQDVTKSLVSRMLNMNKPVLVIRYGVVSFQRINF